MAFGDRLKLARVRAGLSLAALADSFEPRVSPQAINKYERGEMMPSSSVLVGMARALGVSLDFLMSSQVVALEGVEFRKRASVSEREKALIEGEVVDHVERYLAVEEILALPDAGSALDSIQPIVVPTLDAAEFRADWLRDRWEIGKDPIPSMTALLEERGIRVIEIDAPDSFSGLTCVVRRSGNKAPIRVVVHRHFNVERDRFTLAHELAHAVISDCQGAKAEMAMNRFAGALLVPADHLRGEVGTGRTAFGYEELVRLKHIYGVSMMCLLYRLKDVGAITDDRLKGLFRTPARSWLKDEPIPLSEEGDIAKLEKPKRFDSYVYRALAEGLITSVRAADLLRKPVRDVEAAVSGPR
jgi:Zn-dependent peptidase ImmA (M78 family)/transcriptional regulator with XRE-family HTH domain